MESPKDFKDGKIPSLDIIIWISTITIWYDFCQQPMSNNVVLSDSVKISSLTEEVIRRLKHTSEEIPNSHRLETMEHLSESKITSIHNPQEDPLFWNQEI